MDARDRSPLSSTLGAASAALPMLSSRRIHLDTDGHIHTSRTPGTALRGRSALQENTLHHGAMTGNVKGKTGDPFQPRTLRKVNLLYRYKAS